jgi:hypothetical protein
LDFEFLTSELGLTKNSKIKVGKAFFFIFMSSYAEMSFWVPKKRKVKKRTRVQTFFTSNGLICVYKKKVCILRGFQ